MFDLSFLQITDDPAWTYIWFFMFSVLLEEVIFRGFFCKYLARYNRTLAILLSAYLFAMIHGNPVQIVDCFLFGIVTGYVYLETGKLIYPYLMHFFSNFFMTLAFTWYQRYVHGGAASFFIIKVGLALCAILIPLLVLTRIARKKHCLGPVSFCKQVVRSIYTSKGEYRTAFLSPGMLWAHLFFFGGFISALGAAI